MKGYFRAAAGATLAIFAFSTVLAGRSVDRRPDFDAFASGRRPAARPEAVRPDRGQVREGLPVQMEERLGLPTFLWAGDRGRIDSLGLKRAPQGAREAAREHLRGYAPLYRLDPGDVDQAKVRAVHDTGRGVIIVSFYQEVDGIEVFRDEMKMALDRNHDLVSISGYLTRPQARSRVFRLGAPAAIAAALQDLTEHGFHAHDLIRMGRRPADGSFERYLLSPRVEADSGFVAPEPLRARRVWFRLADGLEPAWQTDVAIGEADSTDTLIYGHVISAVDGAVLMRRDFTVSDSYTYRVWADPNDRIPFDGPQGISPSPHPTGTPNGFQPSFVPTHLVTLESGPISTGDPWLPPAATSTLGNNVDAYADIQSPDGFSGGDLRASTTSANTFDRTYNTSIDPDNNTTQRQAAVTQLFYVNNWLHDWFYDAGFDEAAGNAQTDNFGRGGLGNDSLKAEAQDYSGRNNANMSTPPDGTRPRMQMYIFDGASTTNVQVHAPASIAGNYAAGTAAFGPQDFTLTANVVLVNDGAGTTSDGCTVPFVNQAQVANRIALIDRGNCTFAVKAQNAEAEGAIGMIVANNTTGLVNMGGSGAISIPSLSISLMDGNLFKANQTGLNVTMSRTSLTDKDGTIDNQIVAHEWGHYISNRLVGNAFGLNTTMAGGLGEGWGDFHALMLTVRPEDANAPAGANYNGAYPVASYAVSGPGNQAYYFGIRRAPISTDPNINPLTFRHIENGVALPTTAPFSFGQSGANNAQVHNTGEIWSNMLWECYASLLRDTLPPTPRLTFAQAQQRMKDYLVAGYKMTPNSPTLLEARDAVLAAALANDPVDFDACYAAFARRGAGVGAVAPDRFSSSNSGVVESFVTGGALTVTSITLTDDVKTDCFPDGELDNNEVGSLIVTVSNSGSTSLAATTATVTTTNPAVSFPSGNTAPVPSFGPFESTFVTVPVQVSGASGVDAADFTIEFTDPAFVVPSPIVATDSFRINSEDLPGASAGDDVESDNPVWFVDESPSIPTSHVFERIKLGGLDHRWLGPDAGEVTDLYLISPPLNVAPTGTMSLTFWHRFDFETSGGIFYDGGVLEVSNDGGSSWVDIGSSITTPGDGYNSVLATGGGNPLEGRSAFSGRNPGYPNLDFITVDLGTTYQGQTVQVRFRIGTDVFVSAPGWEIDDITFSGITNTPFPILVPHDPTCDEDSDTVVDSADCAPTDPALWSAPSALVDVTAQPLATPGHVRYTFSAPADAGGLAAATYDAVISGTKSGFATGTCVESNDTDLEVVTTAMPPPGQAEFLLIGSRSACGRTFSPSTPPAPPRNVVTCSP